MYIKKKKNVLKEETKMYLKKKQKCTSRRNKST